jgi:hypothetical protein
VNIKGKNLLILGDSHSVGKHSVGRQLSQMLMDGGAHMVMVDAKVGRSPYSFFKFEDGDKRMREVYAKRPIDIVIVFLGTNALAYPRYWQRLAEGWPPGAAVICIGPPTLPKKDQEEVDRRKVVALQKKYFSRWVDLRPFSKGARREPDGVHFHPKGAKIVAQKLYDLVSARSFVQKQKSILGLSPCIPVLAVGWVIQRRMKLSHER